MSIRNKIFLIIGIAIIGLLSVLGTAYYTFSQLNKAEEQVLNVTESTNMGKEIIRDANVARVNDLQFMDTGDMAHVEVVEEQMNHLRSLTEQLSQQVEHKDIERSTRVLIQNSEMYEERFQQLVSTQQKIGLDYTQGLRGELLETAEQFMTLVSEKNDREILVIFQEMEILIKDFISDAIPAMSPFRERVDILEEMIAERSTYTTEEKETLLGLLANYRDHFYEIMDLYVEQGAADTAFNSIISNMEGEIANIEQILEEEYNAIQAQKDQVMSRLNTTVITINIIALIVLIFIGIYTTRSISNSVNRLQTGAKIIGSGNLAYRVDDTTKDEMGLLARTFNDMAAQVQNAFRQVQQASQQLSASSDTLAAVSQETTAQTHEVNQAIEQVSKGAQHQSSDLERGSNLIDAMASQLETVNEHAQQIAEQAGISSTKGKEGLNIVNDLEQTSKEFIELAKTLIANIHEVSNQSRQILDIVSTIEDISDSTDLLALNAAIESARAGEAGRGFAVVADEVRKLAEKTKGEAKNIHEVIKQMNAQMQHLSEEAGQLDEFSEKQGDAVEQTRSSFDDIVDQVSLIENRVEQVQHSLSEVNTSSEQLISAMQDISAISQESAASAEQVAASSENQLAAIEEVNQSAEQLQDLAQQLMEEVNKFQIDEADTSDSEESLEDMGGEDLQETEESEAEKGPEEKDAENGLQLSAEDDEQHNIETTVSNEEDRSESTSPKNEQKDV